MIEHSTVLAHLRRQIVKGTSRRRYECHILRVSNAELTRAFLFVMVFSLLASGWGVNADPSVTDNGNGTTTAVWSFQDQANYTSQNLSLAPSNVTLQREGNLFTDTSLGDFLQGTGFYNVNLTVDPGNVTLENTSLAEPPDTLEIFVDQGSGKDAYISNFPGGVKKNYGASTTLSIQQNGVDEKRAILRFDLAPLQMVDVITSELRLNLNDATSAEPVNVSAHQVLGSWVEGTQDGNNDPNGVSWEDRDGSNQWTASGGDYDPTPSGTCAGITNQTTWHSWDITQLVLDWLNGSAMNHGMILIADDPSGMGGEKIFNSKEYGVPSDRPKLVTYYYNSSGPGYANGTFVSRMMDAQSGANWGNISWDATMPADTNMSLQTRSGDCLGGWSPWSQAYGNALGSQITSPPNRCVQYKTELGTYNQTRKPLLEEVRIDYWKYSPRGFVETEDIQPSNLIGWDVFDSSSSLPLGTNISFSYSADSGTSWIPVLPGENLSVVVSPKMRFKANLTASDTSVSPTLLNMTMTYVHMGPLDHIHMSQATWAGTADDTLDLDAVGHDALHNVVTFIQFWSTTDPTGTVDANGVYNPGTVGAWRVYCNNSDDSVSNHTTV
ncbi:MAG: DNRLRE domain-containing protein, partial [Methanomassiliicoccales archaeon]